MTGRIIGYARTAVHGEEINAQIEALEAAGCADIYTDNGVSSLSLNRPGLQQAQNALRSGDTLMICRLDRISRSVEEFSAFRTELRNSGIQLRQIGQEEIPLLESDVDFKNTLEAEFADKNVKSVIEKYTRFFTECPQNTK